ncbi:MAG: hypothetical protein HN392_06605 [Anaerolineae bacterium]|jgi:hypothetical protein|nr:hypothetical protein [Anaerolineae bacterium]MBT7073905.1 hypothetical protein [Anaerolineae bacterium]MBT7782863.1 hypothetical protein [Anaerolineae bacterium]
MKKSKKNIGLLIIFILIIGAILSSCSSGTKDESAIHSPYVGQEVRGIKALSQDDIEGLLTGAGTPFGGMAKPAELNGYPGPRHVLDAVEAAEFDVSDEQKEKIEVLYEEMRAEAIALGEQIIELEVAIDGAFSEASITEELLEEKVTESARLYGQLRIVHLKYHLSMVDILTVEQVAQYNELRGYTSDDPCNNIPDGHDAELWRQHNNCE